MTIPRMLRHVRTGTLSVSLSLVTMTATACGTSTAREVDPSTFGFGRTPDAAQLASIDIDVSPNGAGLPAGSGTVAEGAAVYRQKCAVCHGLNGEGVAPSPTLVGRTPAAGHVFANDRKAKQTIGNYWPYATTLFDYVRRAMPHNFPGSLTTAETYGVVAFLLNANGIIDSTATMDAKTLPAVQMPARKFFVNDNRTGGAGFK